MVTKQINLYEFEELSQESRKRVINDIIREWVEFPSTVPDDALEFYNKADEDSERMKTPWFFEEYVEDYCKGFILRECQAGMYEENGRFYQLKED